MVREVRGVDGGGQGDGEGRERDQKENEAPESRNTGLIRN